MAHQTDKSNINDREQSESLDATDYLLRSPENARRLISAIERLESGRGIQRGLVE